MPRFVATLVSTLFGAILFGILIAIFGNVPTIVTLIGLIPCLIVYLKVEKSLNQKQNEQSKKREEDDRRFENGEMTGKERAEYAAKQINTAELMFKHGDLTMAEYELLKKKYTGKSFMVDNMSLNTLYAASRKYEANRAIEQHNKNAQKSIIYSAAIGDAIGGPAGAIVGAVSSAQKSAQEAAALEAEKAKADQTLKDAIQQDVRGNR